MEISDELGKPVAGAVVSVRLPDDGPSGTVGLDNLADLLDEFGSPDPSEDLSGDGVVNDPDLTLLLDALFGGGS